VGNRGTERRAAARLIVRAESPAHYRVGICLRYDKPTAFRKVQTRELSSLNLRCGG
jgi:hypothetical protein